MKYEINEDSTQVIFEPSDQNRPPIREQDEFGGETVICSSPGVCRSISWNPKENNKK